MFVWIAISGSLLIEHFHRLHRESVLLTALIGPVLCTGLLVRELRTRVVLDWLWRCPGFLTLAWSGCGLALHSPWLIAWSLVWEGAIRLIPLRRHLPMRKLLCLWGLMTFLLPWPLDLAAGWRAMQQQVAISMSSGILDFCGILHLCEGYSIRTTTQQFQVSADCSGSRTLGVAMVGILVAIVRWNLSGITGALLLGGAVVWSSLVNAMRIAFAAWMTETSTWNVMAEPWHTALGLAALLLMTVILVSQACWSEWWRLRMHVLWTDSVEMLESSELGPRHAVLPVLPEKPVIRTGWLRFMLSIGLLLAGMTLGASGRSTDAVGSAVSVMGSSDRARSASNPDLTLQPRSDWSQGLLRQWDLSGPFTGWHDLVNCYRAAGWKVRDWRIRHYRDRAWDQVRLVHARLGCGVLSFVLLHADGSQLNSASRISMKTVGFSLWTRLLPQDPHSLVDGRMRPGVLNQGFWQLQYWHPGCLEHDESSEAFFMQRWDECQRMLENPELRYQETGE